VYGYAFGQLLTHSLYAKQPDFGERFEPLYLDMLKSGSTRNVTELLKPFDLDPADEKFWANGIDVGLGRMVEEVEQLSRELGVI
jgi:oligoendopeptidase F